MEVDRATQPSPSSTLSGASTVQAGMGSANTSGDPEEEEDEGTRRVIITQMNGRPMTQETEEEFRRA